MEDDPSIHSVHTAGACPECVRQSELKCVANTQRYDEEERCVQGADRASLISNTLVMVNRTMQRATHE